MKDWDKLVNILYMVMCRFRMLWVKQMDSVYIHTSDSAEVGVENIFSFFLTVYYWIV